MASGRIHCVLVATKLGEVVYERFYDRLSELDKAEIRAAFQLASSNVRLSVDDADYAGIFRLGLPTFQTMHADCSLASQICTLCFHPLCRSSLLLAGEWRV